VVVAVVAKIFHLVPVIHQSVHPFQLCKKNSFLKPEQP
jgi:hypothetical protein